MSEFSSMKSAPVTRFSSSTLGNATEFEASNSVRSKETEASRVSRLVGRDLRLRRAPTSSRPMESGSLPSAKSTKPSEIPPKATSRPESRPSSRIGALTIAVARPSG